MTLNKRLWKQIDADKYFSQITIPDDWATLEDFVDWFIDSRMPLMIPYNAEVIQSDDAVAICIFRKGNYQVEFYLEYPRMYIRRHAHPGMDVIVMELGGGCTSPPNENNTSMVWGSISKKLSAGMYHGGESSKQLFNGFVTLAFQRWDNPEEMTSAAIQWKGELQGPIQGQLIKNHKPDALVQPGYADVSSLDK